MGRDISWGADCDSCGTRLNAGRAAMVADGDEVICGSCKDEMRAALFMDSMKVFIVSVQRDRSEPDKILCHILNARRAVADASEREKA